MSLRIYHNQSVYTGGLNSPVITADVVLASEALAIIDKLKCCGNCKHNYYSDEENCQGCCEPKLERWEMRE
jgi:hypothetical protein